MTRAPVPAAPVVPKLPIWSVAVAPMFVAPE